MSLVECSECRFLVPHDASTCQFCGVTRGPVTADVPSAAVATTVGVTAGGAPPNADVAGPATSAFAALETPQPTAPPEPSWSPAPTPPAWPPPDAAPETWPPPDAAPPAIVAPTDAQAFGPPTEPAPPWPPSNHQGAALYAPAQPVVAGPPEWGSGTWPPVGIYEAGSLRRDHRNVAIGLSALGVWIVVSVLWAILVVNAPAPGVSWTRVAPTSNSFSIELPSPVSVARPQSAAGPQVETIFHDGPQLGAVVMEFDFTRLGGPSVSQETIATSAIAGYSGAVQSFVQDESALGTAGTFAFTGAMTGQAVTGVGHVVTIGTRVVVVMVVGFIGQESTIAEWSAHMWGSIVV